MTDQPTPETHAKLASDPHPPSDSPDYARALEIHIHLLRAERDDANALARNYAERMKRSDAELAAARAERDRARAERDELWAENERLRSAHARGADVVRLRAALDEYGEHQGVCPKKYHGMKDARPCTCGLDEALNQAAQ